MGPLGADVEQLGQLAATMRRASGRLGEVALGLERQARAAGWHGPDARRFEREWQVRHRPALSSLAVRCSRLATELLQQAEAQRRASAGAAVAGVAGGGGVAFGGGASASRLGALPRSERRYLGGIEVTAGFFTGFLRGEVAIEQLDAGRVRVTVTDAAGVGAAAGIGATAGLAAREVGGAPASTSGVHATAGAAAGGIERRSWEVDEGEVRGLLVRLAADEALDLATPGVEMPAAVGVEDVIGGGPTADAARVVGGLLDGLVERVTGIDPGLDDRLESALRVPGPDHVEHLAEVGVTAEAGAAIGGLLGPGAHAAAAGSLRVGGGHTAAGRSLLVEYSGSGSGALGAAMARRLGIDLPDPASGAHDIRLELVEQRDGTPDHLLVELSNTAGAELRETTVRVDLSDAAGAALTTGLSGAFDQLARGDVEGAIRTLRSAGAAVPAGSIEVASHTAQLRGGAASAEGAARLGPGVGVAVAGEVLRIDRRG